MSKNTTSSQTAEFPDAAHAVQRVPEAPIPYGLWRRFCDAWDGWCDRRVVTIDSEQVIQSQWLQRINSECGTALEAERRTTHASLATLDVGIAAARQDIDTARIHITQLQLKRDALHGREVSNAATTSADSGDDPDVRRSRNQRRRNAELAAMDGQIKQLEGVIDSAQLRIQTLIMARGWQWTMLITRSVHLVNHYNRRSATYTRHALRQQDVAVRAPQILEPDWLHNGAPAITEPAIH